jgi:hypothetical protein
MKTLNKEEISKLKDNMLKVNVLTANMKLLNEKISKFKDSLHKVNTLAANILSDMLIKGIPCKFNKLMGFYYITGVRRTKEGKGGYIITLEVDDDGSFKVEDKYRAVDVYTYDIDYIKEHLDYIEIVVNTVIS